MWTKISALETILFGFKMMVISVQDFFLFQNSEILASWPGRFSFWQQQQKGSSNFKSKNSRPLFTIIFKPKMIVLGAEILVHINNEF